MDIDFNSNGAHPDGPTGPIKGLTDQERRLDALGLDVLHLRPAYFMENLAFSLDPIRTMGVVGSPLREGLRVSMVATKDIAAAAEHLLRLDFTGSSFRELLGERDVSMAEVTAALNAATGKDLKYVRFPYDAALGAVTSSGLSPDSAAQLVEMYRSMNDGYLVSATARSARATTATTVESCTRDFARVMGLSLSLTAE